MCDANAFFSLQTPNYTNFLTDLLLNAYSILLAIQNAAWFSLTQWTTAMIWFGVYISSRVEDFPYKELIRHFSVVRMR